MIVSPDALRKEVAKLLRQIDAQIAEVEKEAAQSGLNIEQMVDTNGSWVMIPLLLAKTQAYATLVLLNEQGRKP